VKTFRRRAYVNQLPTAKREVEKGDTIVIVKPIYNKKYLTYRIGDMFVVEHVYADCIYTDNGIGLWREEYRVLLKTRTLKRK